MCIIVFSAYDGGPFYDKLSHGRVKYLDLTIPQYGLPLYDWVMSLEVAEHIPHEFEHIYISNIVRHARDGVVLSWAVPNQPGHGHINNQPLDYVIKTFKKQGFGHDPKLSKQLQSKAYVGWLKKNLNVFKRLPNSTIDLNEL